MSTHRPPSSWNVGSNYTNDIKGGELNDTITGGVGVDIISGGKGNDKITGGAGENTVNFLKGDGNDTIYLAEGEKLTINCDEASLSMVDFDIYESGNDVVIAYEYQDGEEMKTDTITVKNLALKNLELPISTSIHSSSQNMPSAYNVPGTVLGSGSTSKNKERTKSLPSLLVLKKKK